MYPAIAHHTAVASPDNVAKGNIFPTTAYQIFSTVAKTTHEQTQGATATDVLPTSAIIQSAYTASCAWCATDAAATASAADVKRALLELPNQAVESATVAMNANSLGAYGYSVTFGTGNAGDQQNIVMNVGGCNVDGCQPRYTGVRLQQVQQFAEGIIATAKTIGGTAFATSPNAGTSLVTDGACTTGGGDLLTVFGGANNGATFTSTACTDAAGYTVVETPQSQTGLYTIVRTIALGDLDTTSGPATNYGATEPSKTYFNAVTKEITRGTKESSECSGRGLCDTETGECTCHEGYTGAACELQTVLF